jgi:MFS transporter, FHS family, L-fucose permease
MTSEPLSPEHVKPRTNWILLVLVCLAYIAFGLVTAVIGVVISRFQETYHVPLWVAALLPFAFYLAYGLCSVPFGLAMDRRGGRPVMLLGMLLMTVGCFLFYFSVNWWLMLIMVFLIGVGVTAIQTAGNPIIRDLDVPEHYSGNLTIIIGIGALGYAISPVLVPMFELKGYNWQGVYLVFGLINLVITGMMAAVPFPAGKLIEDEKVRPETILTLLKNPVIASHTLGIFLYVGAEVGISSYIVTFMERVHGIGIQDSLWAKDSFWYAAFPSSSALAVAVFWALQALGRIAIGPLMTRIRPKTIFAVTSVFCCASLLSAIVGPPRVALAGFMLCGLFTCAMFTVIFSNAIDSVATNHGTISGILCTAVAGGAVVGGLVGFTGESWGLRPAMSLNLLALLYVLSLSMRRGRT